MALDPRTRMAHSPSQDSENPPSLTPFISRPATPKKEDQPPMTAKRRKLHALTEALFDPFTTIQEADLDALMLVATRRTARKKPGS